jgi:hypothetical protein
MRPTLDGLIPAALAISVRLQSVAISEVLFVVSATIFCGSIT